MYFSFFNCAWNGSKRGETKMKETKITLKKCIICNKKYEPTKNYEKKQKYCSHACNSEAYRRNNPEYYQKSLERQRRRYENNKFRLNERIKARTKYKWKHLKKICELCKSKEKVGFHHYTIPYHVDRFLILCKTCHDKIHYFSISDEELEKVYSLIKLREREL